VSTTAVTYIYSWRTKASIGVVLLMAALAAGTLAGFRFVTQNVSKDEITLDEQRFEALRKTLPSRGVVGYVSDRENEADSVRGYYRTQYYLAPLVVASDPGRELVVANLSSPSIVAAFAAAHGLRVTKDFGNGVALLRSAR